MTRPTITPRAAPAISAAPAPLSNRQSKSLRVSNFSQAMTAVSGHRACGASRIAGLWSCIDQPAGQADGCQRVRQCANAVGDDLCRRLHVVDLSAVAPLQDAEFLKVGRMDGHGVG